MARLLRLLPDPAGTHEPGSVDPPEITFISLAAVGERAQPLQRTAPSWRISVQSSGCRRFADGVLAHVRTSGGPSGPAQPSLRFTGSAPTLRSVSGLTRSNRRGTWPVCPVVWEGRRREVPPYPDQCPLPYATLRSGAEAHLTGAAYPRTAVAAAAMTTIHGRRMRMARTVPHHRSAAV